MEKYLKGFSVSIFFTAVNECFLITISYRIDKGKEFMKLNILSVQIETFSDIIGYIFINSFLIHAKRIISVIQIVLLISQCQAIKIRRHLICVPSNKSLANLQNFIRVSNTSSEFFSST